VNAWLKKPSTTGGIIYLISLGMVTGGIALVALDGWRAGVSTMGAAFVLAFIGRLVLPDDRAGMLAVRRRIIDLIGLATCGAALLVLVTLIVSRRG
jgi:hypothetical protein